MLPRPSPAIRNSEFRVGSVGPSLNQSPRRVDYSAEDRELLIRTVLEVVRERRGTHIDGERDRGQCFSCGFLGHGVNRCPRLNRSFPYKTPGWSVNMRNGEYHAARMTGEEHDLVGKRGMVRAGGSASRTISDSNTLTQVGVIVRLGNHRKITLMDPDGPRACRASQFWGALLRLKRTTAIVQYRVVQRLDNDSKMDPLCRPEWDGSHQAPLGCLIKAPRRRMRPAGDGGSAGRVTPAERNDARKKSTVQPLPTSWGGGGDVHGGSGGPHVGPGGR